MSNTATPLEELSQLIDRLIAPDGCSWDREQTPASLCEYIIEETHELVDAIRNGTDRDVCEELGDVMFLIMFISRLYENKKSFTFDRSVSENTAKMIRRHPHVFSGEVFDSREEQMKEWERIKKEEKAANADKKTGVYSSLPTSLPPLTKAYRIHAKAERAGFTWDSDEDVEMQAEAEWLEFLETIRAEDKEAQERELGDLIFTLVELGRRKGIKAAAAVDSTCGRFLKRFSRMEAFAKEGGNEFPKVSMEEKNLLWERAKSEEKAENGLTEVRDSGE